MLDNVVILGLPPHTRGIPIRRAGNHKLIGITPAYAGNTNFVQVSHKKDRDYPRIRGEYLPLLVPDFLISGLPPHTRGILTGKRFGKLTVGITPAYAGNT